MSNYLYKVLGAFDLSVWNVQIILAVFVFLSLFIILYDIKSYRIPDFLTIPGITSVIILRLAFGIDKVLYYLMACVCGYLFFALIRIITKGKLGLGDAKYSAFIGIVFGLIEWYIAVVIATFLSAGYICFLLIKKQPVIKRPVPFAPFLFSGAIALLLFRIFVIINIESF